MKLRTDKTRTPKNEEITENKKKKKKKTEKFSRKHAGKEIAKRKKKH